MFQETGLVTGLRQNLTGWASDSHFDHMKRRSTFVCPNLIKVVYTHLRCMLSVKDPRLYSLLPFSFSFRAAPGFVKSFLTVTLGNAPFLPVDTANALCLQRA